MKIAVASSGADLDSGVVSRLGTSNYLLVVDPDTMTFEGIPCSSASSGPGAGIRVVTLALSHDAQAILTRYVAPHMEATLRENQIDVMTGLKGTVEWYVAQSPPDMPAQGKAVGGALARSMRQFVAMLPMLFGVVLLAGMLKVFVSKAALTSVFSGRPITDTVWGACFGSIIGGNAVNSYVIGAALRDAGVSLFAVTAMMITWVTVGLVQLPAEMSAFGARFGIWRNSIAFVVSLGVALLTVTLVRWLS